MRLFRLPWGRRETRDSGGDFTDAVVRLIEAQAAGTAADASSTAAVEAAAGALSRAMASARVEGPSHVLDAVTPGFLAQVGRDLIRSGDSMHVIRVTMAGRVELLPCSSWHFEGSASPDTWTVRATTYGPSTSTTRHLPFAGVVFVKWGSTPGQPYVGIGPTSWAHLTARLQSEAERSIADEAQGVLAQLMSVPESGAKVGPDGEVTDPTAKLRADLASARGKTAFVETTAGGWGGGRGEAPRSDWRASRLGPMPPDSMVRVRSDTFSAVLAATGTPPALFDNSDGTSQRESFRRYLTLTVQPMARVLARELAHKLDAPGVSLTFDDLYAHDLQGRATAFQKLVKAGVPVTEALTTSGLLASDGV